MRTQNETSTARGCQEAAGLGRQATGHQSWNHETQSRRQKTAALWYQEVWYQPRNNYNTQTRRQVDLSDTSAIYGAFQRASLYFVKLFNNKECYFARLAVWVLFSSLGASFASCESTPSFTRIYIYTCMHIVCCSKWDCSNQPHLSRSTIAGASRGSF